MLAGVCVCVVCVCVSVSTSFLHIWASQGWLSFWSDSDKAQHCHLATRLRIDVQIDVAAEIGPYHADHAADSHEEGR